MKILICDDDKTIPSLITGLLRELEELKKLPFQIKAYGCGEDVLKHPEPYDLAFVDIEMPGMNGLRVTKHLQKLNPNTVIFIITSHQSYLDDAMDLHVFRYLSKPIDRKRFMKSMETAINIYQQSTRSVITETYDECIRIFTKDILYITIENRKSCIVTADRALLSRQSFDHWRQQLTGYECFVQPHYSFIVNLQHVTRFTKTEITLDTGGRTCIPVSRRFYPLFKKAFYQYIGATI